jgi:hypothetical protein
MIARPPYNLVPIMPVAGELHRAGILCELYLAHVLGVRSRSLIASLDRKKPGNHACPHVSVGIAHKGAARTATINLSCRH